MNDTTTNTQAAPTPDFGLSGRTVMVHKENEEGALLIDAESGLVIPGQAEKPDWAAHLACAQLQERHAFYTTRLGSWYTEAMQHPEVFAYEDLAWVAVDPDTGNETEVEADAEHRMNVIAMAAGVDLETGDVKDAKQEVEIATDTYRTAEEIAALDEAQAAGFVNTEAANG